MHHHSSSVCQMNLPTDDSMKTASNEWWQWKDLTWLTNPRLCSFSMQLKKGGTAAKKGSKWDEGSGWMCVRDVKWFQQKTHFFFLALTMLEIMEVIRVLCCHVLHKLCLLCHTMWVTVSPEQFPLHALCHTDESDWIWTTPTFVIRCLSCKQMFDWLHASHDRGFESGDNNQKNLLPLGQSVAVLC